MEDFERVAWTGGSSPGLWEECTLREREIVLFYFTEQIEEFRNYWKVDPDVDTTNIFWNRARHDGWATYRAEKFSGADLLVV